MDAKELSREYMSSERVEPMLSDSLTYRNQPQFTITIIVPTKNEMGNIEPLLTRINQATKGLGTEVVFVDDSTDDTPQVIRNLRNQFPFQITLIARPPERRGNGLGGAVVEGLRIARAPWVCVMDGDLQHPPELIPQILRHAKESEADIVVGSRLAPGGNVSSLGRSRILVSRLLAMAARAAFPVRLRKITDPLSGFFIARRAALNLDALRPDGFKILLEILIRCPDLRVSEMPIQFGYRHAGESKASVQEVFRFYRLMLRLRLTGAEGFARFLAVGVSGLVVNNLVLAAFIELMGLHYLVSAVVATQVSTLWNFSLTEAWVFKQRRTGHSTLNRLVSFLLINNLLLILRGPLLALMVDKLGVHYLISNLVSLAAITLLRYFMADQWIWTEASQEPHLSVGHQKRARRLAQMINFNHNRTAPRPEPFVYSYDIHGIVRVISMFQLPELEYFRVASLSGDPDIRLRLERRYRQHRRKERTDQPRRSENNIHYEEGFGRLGFEVTIAHKLCVEVAVSPILKYSRHVLYTNIIEPILRWTFVRKGYVLLHAACVAFNGKAVLVTARTDTGKTSTILRAVEHYSCSFLSDDMTIVGRDGKVMSYPKPLTISSHTLRAVNGGAALSLWERLALQIQSRLHSRSGRRIGLQLSETKLPAATMNSIVQMIIPPPKYMVDRLIPKATYANGAALSHAVVIERGPEFEETLDHAEAVDVFVHNAEDAYGFPPYPTLAPSLSKWNDEDLHIRETTIIFEALKHIPTLRLRDPNYAWWQRLPVVTSNFSSTAMQVSAADD
jgi:dolichol-phosphate mannosyltransferase